MKTRDRKINVELVQAMHALQEEVALEIGIDPRELKRGLNHLPPETTKQIGLRMKQRIAEAARADSDAN